MKSLIKGQTIRIDNHNAGNRGEATYDRSLHIHKIMNSDRYCGAEILIPLNSNNEIEYRKIKGNKDQKKQLRTEITTSFKDRRKKKDFVNDIFDIVTRYSQNKSIMVKIDNLIGAANAIAKHFDLKDADLKPYEDRIKDAFFSTHYDNDGNRYYILQDLGSKEPNIRIGSDKDLIKDWDKIKKNFDKE